MEREEAAGETGEGVCGRWCDDCGCGQTDEIHIYSQAWLHIGYSTLVLDNV